MDYEQLMRMGKGVRLVITDMDGTLLTSEKLITRRTRDAVTRLTQAGKGFTICTGRIPAMIASYVRELALTLPVVTANGAVVWDPIGEKPLFEKSIPPDDAENIMKYCTEHQLDYSVLTLENSYFSLNSVRIERFQKYNQIAKRRGNPQMKLQYLQKGCTDPPDEKIYKFLIYEPNSEQYQSAGRFLETLSGIQVTCSDLWLWDISAAGVSKGTGLAYVKKYLGLKSEEVCAFGDYDNDVSMLTQAGFSVAMKNGCDTIKSKAAYVTGSNDEDGVAAVIEEFCLL